MTSIARALPGLWTGEITALDHTRDPLDAMASANGLVRPMIFRFRDYLDARDGADARAPGPNRLTTMVVEYALGRLVVRDMADTGHPVVMTVVRAPGLPVTAVTAATQALGHLGITETGLDVRGLGPRTAPGPGHLRQK